MDTTPLPNRDCESSDSDYEDELSLTFYLVRITCCDKFTDDEIVNFFKEEPQICQYVIGKETDPQIHYHLVLGVSNEMQPSEVRDIVRAFLVPFWQENGKLHRGFGNKQYNLQVARDVDEGVSYAVKLRKFWFEGFTQEYIDQRVAVSYEKKKPSNFKAEYLKLCDDFQKTDMDIRDFMSSYVTLKAKYGQSVRMSDAYGYAISNLIKREPSKAEEMVEEYLYKL